MKNKKVFFTLLAAGVAAVSALIFAACSNISLNEHTEKSSQNKICEKAQVSISFSADSGRTALPSINWDDFTYTLTAIQNPGEATQKDSVTLFTDRTKEQLVQGAVVDIGKYKFTLTAKYNGTPALSGVTTTDLSQNTTLTFRMMAVAGGKGTATVKISYPSTESNTVGSVKAAYSKELFASVEGTELSSHFVAGEYVYDFAKADLPSGIEQYALFWVYDKAGALIYSGAESLAIVTGCESTSSISLSSSDWHTYLCSIQLNKNGAAWIGSGHKIKAVQQTDNSKYYSFKEGLGGAYTASVAESLYDIYVDDVYSGASFNSVNKTAALNYWTVSMAETKAVTMIPLSGIDIKSGYAAVINGSNFKYSLATNQGYDGTPVIKVNGVTVEDVHLDEGENTISAVKEAKTISVSGITPVVYSISYREDDGSEISSSSDLWVTDDGYSVPFTYSVEDAKELPTLTNIRKNGKVFDCWKKSDGTVVKETEGFYENLVLTANWKNGVTVDSTNKWLYANGINLLICSEDSETHVYVDFDGDGIVDNGVDYQVNAAGVTNFENYHLSAGTMNGDEINSDFKFTMTGGTIASIIGMGSSSPNKTWLNVSGNAVIGSAGALTKIENSDGTVSYYTNEVCGIELETITDERVVINAQMNGDYKVICVTPHLYDSSNDRIIAKFNNNNYASMAQFNCYTRGEFTAEGKAYEYYKQTLTKKDRYLNGVLVTTVHLTDPDGVILPDASDVTGDVEDVIYGFTLGDDRIGTNCSVFSVSVTNGTFSIGRETLTENLTEADLKVEKTLSYMAMPDASSYVDETNYKEKNIAGSEHVFSFKNAAGEENRYIYMQIMSSGELVDDSSSEGSEARGNTINSAVASDFLSKMIFRRTGSEQMKIKVNLEVVPAKDISPEKVTGLDSIITDSSKLKAHKLVYFDGSWYVRVNQAVPWPDAYNASKTLYFNSLKGYLMNVTSKVENNYVFFQYNSDDAMSWFGASRLVPKSGTYDLDTYEYKDTNGGTEWKWQSGPEAGQTFWKTKTGPTTSSKTFVTVEATYDAARATALAVASTDGAVEGMFSYWNNDFIFKDLWQFHCTYLRPNQTKPGLYQYKLEPNGSTEPCAQFLSGKVKKGANDEYQSDGYWNDISYATTTGSNATTAYFVEFTPYGDVATDYAPITKVAYY